MEASLELDDDVFFKDLSKQISLLIMDDEVDDDGEHSLSLSPPLNLQAFTQAIHSSSTQASFFSYDHHQQASMRDQSKGTGVFIPRSTSNPRRKNVKAQPRFMASGNKFQRSLAHSNNMINPSYDNSFHFRRF